MHTPKTLIAAAAVAAFAFANAALAQDTVAPTTRAEVKAETLAALKAEASIPGGVGLGRPMYDDGPFVSTRSRSEVSAEARTSVARGETLHGEVWRVEPVARVTAVGPTRAEVKAETRIAVRNGRIQTGEQGPYESRS